MRRSFAVLVTACAVIAGFLTFSPIFAETPATSPNSETAAIDALYQLEQLPRLMSGDSCKMFSSYDRTGGNDDGFKGTYSKLRVENGNSVLAEMTGAGCIERIHLPHSFYAKPGLLGLKGEHIRIYLDGNEKPALDVPLEDIFRGKVDGFPKPLVGEGSGGHYCYVPMPYRNGCKVEVDGTAIRFYAVVYRTYPSDEGVVTFTNPPTDAQRKALDAAAKVWSSCGDLSALGVTDAEQTEKPVELTSGETKSMEIALPPGPRMVRAIYLSGDAESLKNAGGVRLKIFWDGSEKPAVDMPLDYLFCQAMQPKDFRSLLVGVNDQGWYNYMPMPYGKSAKIVLTADKPLEGKLTVVTTKLPQWNGELGYLHTEYNESLPNQKGKFHPWLTHEGRGHYVGTYMVTEGVHKVPYWLEGDELFTCDGELRIHGTGTEDCFNCGWYAVPGRLMGPCAFPLHGFSVYGPEGEKFMAAAFRWQVSDTIPYEKSIEAKIEHGPANNSKTNYRSAAFYYDATP